VVTAPEYEEDKTVVTASERIMVTNNVTQGIKVAETWRHGDSGIAVFLLLRDGGSS
jgi:hypothetical protein